MVNMDCIICLNSRTCILLSAIVSVLSMANKFVCLKAQPEAEECLVCGLRICHFLKLFWFSWLHQTEILS